MSLTPAAFAALKLTGKSSLPVPLVACVVAVPPPALVLSSSSPPLTTTMPTMTAITTMIPAIGPHRLSDELPPPLGESLAGCIPWFPPGRLVRFASGDGPGAGQHLCSCAEIRRHHV